MSRERNNGATRHPLSLSPPIYDGWATSLLALPSTEWHTRIFCISRQNMSWREGYEIKLGEPSVEFCVSHDPARSTIYDHQPMKNSG